MSTSGLLRLLLVLALASHQGGGPASSQSPLPENVEWIELKGGLRYADLEVGEGAQARTGRTVQVHYTGWLADGSEFQSSRDSGVAFVFELGAGQVIPGWERGMRGMREGGRRLLEIPPKLAYGKRGAGTVIPANATLTFEIELLAVSR